MCGGGRYYGPEGQPHTGYDERRRQGLAGPEMMAIREEKARAVAADKAAQQRAERLAAGLPTEEFEAPFGAQCCDTLLFAPGEWLSDDATEVYTQAYVQSRRRREQEAGTAGEKQPLLSGGGSLQAS